MIQVKGIKVLVVPEPEDNSGIVIPESAKKRPSLGMVHACGSGTDAVPMEYKPGDKVIFPSGTGTPIFIDDVEYLLFTDCRIIIGTIVD